MIERPADERPRAAPTTLRVGSLFSGYRGLEMAVQAVLGGTVTWHSEIDPAAARLLTHHHPDVPNLGDITAIDWSTVEPVDVLTGGFPCQDVSSAGQRAGMRPTTRSGLWTHMAYAIDQLRPSLVLIENVRGLLSADAHCDLEPCPWCLGDDEGRPLRALGCVLGDLANIGYDARWVGLRAADIGAPHGRYRIFIAAWPADSDPAAFGRGTAGRDDGLRPEGLVTEPAADADCVGSVRSGGARGRRGGSAHDDLPAADTSGGELQRRGVGGVLAGPEGTRVGEGAERQRDRHPASDGGAALADADHGPGLGERARPGPRDGSTAVADAVRDGREGHSQRNLGQEAGQPAPLGGDAPGRVLDWGAYEPAIRRWESILGRVAPAPTMTGRRGGQQLSPRFVEWMQGLPDGHVTSVPGLTRNDQLRLLGNGVVWQQAAAALRWLLASAAEPAERAA